MEIGRCPAANRIAENTIANHRGKALAVWSWRKPLANSSSVGPVPIMNEKHHGDYQTPSDSVPPSYDPEIPSVSNQVHDYDERSSGNNEEYDSSEKAPGEGRGQVLSGEPEWKPSLLKKEPPQEKYRSELENWFSNHPHPEGGFTPVIRMSEGPNVACCQSVCAPNNYLDSEYDPDKSQEFPFVSDGSIPNRRNTVPFGNHSSSVLGYRYRQYEKWGTSGARLVRD